MKYISRPEVRLVNRTLEMGRENKADREMEMFAVPNFCNFPALRISCHEGHYLISFRSSYCLEMPVVINIGWLLLQ